MKELMKKYSKTQIFIIIFVVLCLGGYYYYFSHGSFPFTEKAVAVKEQKTNDSNTTVTITENNKVIVSEFPFSMSEEDVQQAIHNMSHQKVEADKKWGAIPLSPERVNRLIQVVEENKKKYKHADVYLNILGAWAKKDFSHVDKDHNDIWQLQGGTIGKAYGISTENEEKAFIKEHFKVTN